MFLCLDKGVHFNALITIHRSYANLVFSVAMRVLGNQADAEEISQDVFISSLV